MVYQWFLVLFAWISLITFVILMIYKIKRIYSLPLNLRWELYPVPHENSDKRKYGGSYMEEVDWVKKPKTSSKLAVLPEMGAEIFFLKRVREYNTYNIWPFSMALHWGLYLLVIWVGLLGIASVMPGIGSVIKLVGIPSLFLGMIGSVGLIVRRMSTPDLKLYTTMVDYFHLAFLMFVFGFGLISWVIDPNFVDHQTYIHNMLTFRPGPVPGLVSAMFVTLQTFAIYMPFSKLIHYAMKHFTFTETLWDDSFNVKGSAKDKRIQRQLEYTKSWAGPHFSVDKTWIEDVKEVGKGESGT